MTYKEAIKQLDDNRKLLDMYIMHSKPPHRILCSFVSVQNMPIQFHEALFEAIHDRHLDNKEHLTELGVIDRLPMLPIVALLMWGNTVLVALNDYISFRGAMDEETGKAS